MTDQELVEQCRIALFNSALNTNFDSVITQKIQIVKSYMVGAGVSDALLADPLAMGIIVVGVTDIWNLTGGAIKFSPVFHLFLIQLATRSLPKEGDA